MEVQSNGWQFIRRDGFDTSLLELSHQSVKNGIGWRCNERSSDLGSYLTHSLSRQNSLIPIGYIALAFSSAP